VKIVLRGFAVVFGAFKANCSLLHSLAVRIRSPGSSLSLFPSRLTMRSKAC